MNNLLFLRRSCKYRQATAAAFQEARAMPVRSSERNKMRVLGRSLRDLARTEAWLEGQRLHVRLGVLRAPALPASEPDISGTG